MPKSRTQTFLALIVSTIPASRAPPHSCPPRRDLVRFGMAINSGKMLQPATVQSLQAPQRLPSGEETGYGLGWDLETVLLAGEQTRVAGHNGELMGGMVASFITSPKHGIVVAVASNTSYADTYSLAVSLAQAFGAAERGHASP